MALFGRRRRAETQDSPLGGPWIVGRRATERSAERARGTPLLALLECARAPAEIWGVRRVAPAAPGLLFTLYASLFPCLTNQKASHGRLAARAASPLSVCKLRRGSDLWLLLAGRVVGALRHHARTRSRAADARPARHLRRHVRQWHWNVRPHVRRRGSRRCVQLL